MVDKMKYKLFISCSLILCLVSCNVGVSRQLTPPKDVLLTVEPSPYQVVLRNGQTVQLGAGIQQDVIDQLKSGKPAYLVLAFETPSDPSIQSVFNTVRISGLTMVSFSPGEFTSFLTVVQPESLATLQDWVKNRYLRAAAKLPPDAKLNPKLVEELKDHPKGMIRVSVDLFVFPEGEQKKELSRFFQDVYFPSGGGVKAINGKINKRNIPKLLELPYVIFVSESFGGIILPPP